MEVVIDNTFTHDLASGFVNYLELGFYTRKLRAIKTNQRAEESCSISRKKVEVIVSENPKFFRRCKY
jgi:hypothetical protein